MQTNFVLTEGTHTNFIFVTSPEAADYKWVRFGGDAVNGSDYLLTWSQGLDTFLVDDSGTMSSPPLAAIFAFTARQDHTAESAETVSFHLSTVVGGQVTGYDVNVTILDRSTRDEYLTGAMAKAVQQFDPTAQPNQLLEQSYINQVTDFMGPVNDPTNSNVEAHQAQQYLIGALGATDWSRLGALPMTQPDFEALRWAAAHFDRTWLLSDPRSLDGSPPIGVLDALEGFIEGKSGAWRQHLPGAAASPAAGAPFLVDVRTSDQTFHDLGLFRHDAFDMTTGPDLLPAGPVDLLVDKVGGAYTLSSGDDGLLASATVNVSLGAGDDFAVAVGAGSQLSGGDGHDVLVLGDGGGSLSGGSGADLLVGGASGTNFIRGDDGDDFILGGSGFDNINGNRGDDTIDGGAGGGDWLVGGQGSDMIVAHASNTVLYGNIGDDTLIGGSGDDTLRGGQDNDVIQGGAGNDWISGDVGNDTLTGGAGADSFHTFGGAGRDVVTDFDPSEGDRVVLDPGSTYVAQQVGADTVITVHAGLQIAQMVLAGVRLNNMPSDWIVVG